MMERVTVCKLISLLSEYDYKAPVLFLSEDNIVHNAIDCESQTIYAECKKCQYVVEPEVVFIKLGKKEKE